MLKNRPQTWVIVADNCKAKIYNVLKFPKLEEIANLEHPESRLLNQELVSSKPGRGFQSVGNSRSAYQPETEPRQVEAIKFASEIARHLYTAVNNGEFKQLYVIAEPSFLGLLRQHLNPNIQKLIVVEIPKELTSQSKEAIEHHLEEI